jgi:NDP-sugar pyrophosphorylase family protein
MNPAFVEVSAAILAGGLGTRLRPAIADRPKVLAPVAGRPFLAYLLDQLEAAGVRQVVLLVGYGADHVRATFGDRHGGMTLAYSAESEPLGTAGAVRLALPQLERDSVLLLNGDSYFGVDLAAFQRFHFQSKGDVSLCLAHVDDAARFGRVQLGPGDRIARFEEKHPTPAPGWINAGIYMFRSAALETIPAGREVSLEREVLPRLVEKASAFGFCSAGRFIDIGVPESYLMAESFFAH